MQPPLANARRSTVLSLIVVATAVVFAATFFVNQAYQLERVHLGRTWFEKGEQSLSARQPDAAAEAFRTALVYSPNNPQYELRLAQALARAGREREATAYFLGLLQQEPGDGLINLEVARLSARAHDVAAAMRYFHAAIYGAWSEDATTRRRTARFELIEFLLAEHADTQARSELISLTDDLPRDGSTVLKVAGMFLAAQDYDDALRMFEKALALGVKSRDVYSGAGTAAYQAGRYRDASNYLGKAGLAGADSQIVRMLETANAVLRLDPFEPGLRQNERARRAARSLAIAGNRLQTCTSGPMGETGSLAGLAQEWKTSTRRANLSTLTRHPELVDSTMDLVFRIEHGTQDCAMPTPEDAALSLINRRRTASPQ